MHGVDARPIGRDPSLRDPLLLTATPRRYLSLPLPLPRPS